MLGCQDFCGYYDWTFYYLQREYGTKSVTKLWRETMAQTASHYTKAGLQEGLRGLYEQWITTGKDEQCDWTFTLDETKNTLRWDMRECPSKGHLIQNDRHAYEDYCDHCMGWIEVVLDNIGGEVVAHEHNHCGQCWAEMRMKDKPSGTLSGINCDITNDPRWKRGYLERWENNTKLPLLRNLRGSIDSVDVLRNWFAEVDHLTVLGRGSSAKDHWTKQHITDAVIITDPTYVTRDVYSGEPLGVLIDDNSQVLARVAERFHATPNDHRPLLMHMYLPHAPMQAFVEYNLPRPVPILPLLIREGVYCHQPFDPCPTTEVFALLLATALNKLITVTGLDFYSYPSGDMYVDKPAKLKEPYQHSEACDFVHIKQAIHRLGNHLVIHPILSGMLLEVACLGKLDPA